MSIYEEITSTESSKFEMRFGSVTKVVYGWLIPLHHRTEFFEYRKTMKDKPKVYKDKVRGDWFILRTSLKTKKRDLSLTIHNQFFKFKKDVYSYCKNLAESKSKKFEGDDDLFLRALFSNHPYVFEKFEHGCKYFYSKLNEYGTGYEFWYVNDRNEHDDISYSKTLNEIYSKKLGV